MEAEEVFRWLYRHHAALEFLVDESGDDMVEVTTPLRGEAGGYDRASALVQSHMTVVFSVTTLVENARERLGME